MKRLKRILEEESAAATVSSDIAKVPTKVGEKPLKKKKPVIEESEIEANTVNPFTVADLAVLLSEADEETLVDIANYIIEEYYDEEDCDDEEESDYEVDESIDGEVNERKKKKIVWRAGKKKKIFISTKKKAGFRLSGVKSGGKGGKESFVSKAKRNKESLHKIIAKRKSKGKTRLAVKKRARTMRKSGR